MNARLEGHGLAVTLPDGWDGTIYRRQGDQRQRALGGIETPVLHAANFPLPPDPADFASHAVNVMGRGHVVVALIDMGPESVGTALYRTKGLPRRVDPDDYSPQTLQRPMANRAGVQRFFTEADRAFCLYSVIGNYKARRLLVPLVNDILPGIEIA